MEIKDVLKNYIVFINSYEILMSNKYDIKENISLWEVTHQNIFERQGVINDYKYFYHGSGCRLEKDGIVCEYDTAPLNGYEIKFSYWKFLEFIRTNPKYNKLNITRDYMEIGLNKLVEEGILSWCIIDGYSYSVLQILRKNF